MKSSLGPGMTSQFRYLVPEDKTVPHVYPESPLFREMPPVFASGDSGTLRPVHRGGYPRPRLLRAQDVPA
jgi:hypothetical protein